MQWERGKQKDTPLQDGQFTYQRKSPNQGGLLVCAWFGHHFFFLLAHFLANNEEACTLRVGSPLVSLYTLDVGAKGLSWSGRIESWDMGSTRCKLIDVKEILDHMSFYRLSWFSWTHIECISRWAYPEAFLTLFSQEGRFRNEIRVFVALDAYNE